MAHRIPWVPLLAIGWIVLPGAAVAQTQSALNPEISFIADMRILAADATPDDLEFDLNGLELGAQGYLNPFARADIFIAFHDGQFELEEAFATLTALPGGFALRGGQFRMRIDRFNPPHNHVFPWLDYPGLITTFFGEEGYIDVGLNPSWMMSIGDVPITFEGDIANGNFNLEGHEHEEEGGQADSLSTEGENRSRTLGDLTYDGRATIFFTLDTRTWLELGGSVGTGMLDFDGELRGTWYGGDAKFRWRPSRRTSLDIAAEVMAQERKQPAVGIRTPLGAFGYFNYQFWRNWNIGALVDYVEVPENPSQALLGFGGFAGYSLYEETAVIRLLVRNDDLPGNLGSETLVKLQLLFGLGPHRAHTFQ
jgi:hypothetical protein